MLRRAFCAAFVSAAAAAVSLLTLKSRGLLLGSRPDRFENPARGAYISQRCGEVNWKTLPQENVDFCYIRTTSGIAFADSRAEYNLKGAAAGGLLYGAVHDLDPAVGGRAQADNFLSVAGTMQGRLVPVLDIRLSLAERIRFGDKYSLARTVSEFIERLKEREGCGAVLLCDGYVYEKLSLGESGALIWADSKGLCSDPFLLTYSDSTASPSVMDGESGYTALTAGRYITPEQLSEHYTVRRRED